MRMSGCPCLTRRQFRRDTTDALFADQSQSIPDNLMELIGPELSACNGATEAARSVAVSNVSRPSSAKERLATPGTLIVAVGLIFEVGCAKEPGQLARS